HTAHTVGPVPLVYMGTRSGVALREGGALRDVAPTLPDLRGIPRPEAMTGRSLLVPAEQGGGGWPGTARLAGGSRRERRSYTGWPLRCSHWRSASPCRRKTAATRSAGSNAPSANCAK